MRPRRGLGRTSCMLLAINLVFIFTFTPFMALELFKAAKPDVVHAMSEVPLAIFNLFLKSHLLNSAANPIVYSLCDVSFRRQCRQFLKRR
ncbi:unnamed protein product [Lymnaea stagnalis]|uniref:G-protein coupled receptors family 1 profile domain-containing protein n=1 Tax=Lymnaea stagnalis TaxID=6523 RepID=A0AAV2IDJ7_LYMST